MSQLSSRAVTGAFAAAIAMTVAGGREASAQSSVMQGLLQDTARPVAQAREYATPDGAVRFVFDRSGRSAALVRFEGDPEVHVLRPVGGVGGDEIYRTEGGDVSLRLTPHGGITVYTRANRTGSPVSEGRDVAPLLPPQPPAAAYQSGIRRVEVTVTRRVGRPVAFAAPPPPANPSMVSGVALDAAERAAEGLQGLPSDMSIQRVAIILGPAPAAFVRGDTLFIQIVPQMGYAGRPSTAQVRAVLQGDSRGPDR